MKNKCLAKLPVTLLFFFTLNMSWSQTTLSTGDIAFTSYSSEPTANDTFAFMLLTDISSTTTIVFTDGLWRDANGYFLLNSALTDWVCVWQSTSALLKGTQVKIWSAGTNCIGCGAVTSNGVITGGRGLVFPTSGDQLFAVQGGTIDTVSATKTYTPTTVITGIHMNRETSGNITTTTNWDNGATTSTSQSELPPALTTGVNAIWLTIAGLEIDNARLKYSSLLVSGTATQVRTYAIDPANWEGDDIAVMSPAIAPATGGLPVTLIHFGAITAGSDIRLLWEVSDETDFSHYEVEKSEDGRHFSFEGKITIAPGSAVKNYSWLDTYVAAGIKYYRLRMVDIDGAYTFSKVIKILQGQNSLVARLYPNPASESVTVSSSKKISSVDFIDSEGRPVLRIIVNKNADMLNITALKQGIYQVRINTTEGSSFQAFTIIR